jgi:hypothetical protein
VAQLVNIAQQQPRTKQREISAEKFDGVRPKLNVVLRDARSTFKFIDDAHRYRGRNAHVPVKVVSSVQTAGGTVRYRTAVCVSPGESPFTVYHITVCPFLLLSTEIIFCFSP